MIARRQLVRAALALALLPLGSTTALAHQEKITITTVSLNPRTGMIEIAHQVPLHDAEHALRFQGMANPDIIGSVESLEAFARYIARRFMLAVNGAVVSPDYVGSETTGGNLWFYQVTPAPEGEAQVAVNSQILTDIWARQENRVNIGGGTRVTTFIFKAGDAPQAASLCE